MTTRSAVGQLVIVDRLSRRLARAHPDGLFVFGDNLAGSGRGGQAAAIRGEPNAIGIPTKRRPSRHDSAFFTDSDLAAVAPVIDSVFARLESHLRSGGDVYWPAAGVGSGRAELPTRAPAIAAHIRSCASRLRAVASVVVEPDSASDA
jgi:hypothetical protein